MRATVEWPSWHGVALKSAFVMLAKTFREKLEARLGGVFPQRDAPDRFDLTYLWARTIRCPYCEGLVPLSPNWRLAPGGTGVRLQPRTGSGPGDPTRKCDFEIVETEPDQSSGTAADGDATCPFTDCTRVIDGDEIKRQAQAGDMSEQLFAVVFKQRIETRTKTGKRGRDKWERGYRAPQPEDDMSDEIAARLATKMEEWSALDYVPNEHFPLQSNDDRPIQYGMPLWRDMFAPRQLLCHGTAVEVYRDLLSTSQREGTVTDVDKAAFTYLSFALDKVMTYNCRRSRWHPGREVLAQIFERHDFSVTWTSAGDGPLDRGSRI